MDDLLFACCFWLVFSSLLVLIAILEMGLRRPSLWDRQVGSVAPIDRQLGIRETQRSRLLKKQDSAASIVESGW